MWKLKIDFSFQGSLIASELIQLGKAEINYFPGKNAAKVLQKNYM